MKFLISNLVHQGLSSEHKIHLTAQETLQIVFSCDWGFHKPLEKMLPDGCALGQHQLMGRKGTHLTPYPDLTLTEKLS